LLLGSGSLALADYPKSGDHRFRPVHPVACTWSALQGDPQ